MVYWFVFMCVYYINPTQLEFRIEREIVGGSWLLWVDWLATDTVSEPCPFCLTILQVGKVCVIIV